MKPFGVVRFTVAWLWPRVLGFTCGWFLSSALHRTYPTAWVFMLGAAVCWLVFRYGLKFKSRKEANAKTENHEA